MTYTIADLCLWTWTLISSGATFYYGATISGMYKNAMMANFRRYGSEHRACPLCWFLGAGGTACILWAIVLKGYVPPIGSRASREYVPLAFEVAALIFGGFFAVIWLRPELRETLPHWYFELLKRSSRQERRFIGYAWLRIPLKMRWRLSGDQKAFQVWADMVRLTVIYGAYDPDSPWDRWT